MVSKSTRTAMYTQAVGMVCISGMSRECFWVRSWSEKRSETWSSAVKVDWSFTRERDYTLLD